MLNRGLAAGERGRAGRPQWQQSGMQPGTLLGKVAKIQSLAPTRRTTQQCRWLRDQPAVRACSLEHLGGSTRHVTATAQSAVGSKLQFQPVHLPLQAQLDNRKHRRSPKCAAAQTTSPSSSSDRAQAAVGASSAPLGDADKNNLLWARLWFLSTSGAVCFVLPFLNLYYANVLGFSSAQIGLLGALKPWMAIPFGNLWASLADSTRKHRLILIAFWCISTCTRSGMGLAVCGSFGAQLALSLITEAFASPVPIIADAAVMASVKNEGDYGKQRMFGAIGWGGTSVFAGLLVTNYGLKTGFVAYFLASIIALGPTAMLPVQSLMGMTIILLCSTVLAMPGCCCSLCRTQNEGGAAATSTMTLALLLQSLYKNQEDDDVELQGAGSNGQQHSLGNGKPILGGNGQMGAAMHQNNAQPFGLRSRTGGSTPGGSGVSGTGFCSFVYADGQSGGGSDFSMAVAESVTKPLISMYETLEEDWEWESGQKASRGQKRRTLLQTASAQAWDLSAMSHPLADVAPPQTAGLLSLEEDEDLPESGMEFQQKASRLSFLEACKVLFSDQEVAIFFAKTTLLGLAIGAISSYLFMYLSLLGGTESLMGLTLAVSCASEAPFFFFAGKVIDRLGVKRVIDVALSVYVLRLTCYALLPLAGNPWVVLPVELLHGVTFGCSWAAGTVNCARISPPGLKSTTQAVFSSLYFGLGAGTGALAGGVLYGSVGPQILFACIAGVVSMGWAACEAFERLHPVSGPSFGVTLRTMDE